MQANFDVDVRIKQASLHGLSALDESRRLGLPDTTDLSFGCIFADFVVIPVSEAFARKRPEAFANADRVWGYVSRSALVAGDVSVDTDGLARLTTTAVDRLAILASLALPEEVPEEAAERAAEAS